MRSGTFHASIKLMSLGSETLERGEILLLPHARTSGPLSGLPRVVFFFFFFVQEPGSSPESRKSQTIFEGATKIVKRLCAVENPEHPYWSCMGQFTFWTFEHKNTVVT